VIVVEDKLKSVKTKIGLLGPNRKLYRSTNHRNDGDIDDADCDDQQNVCHIERHRS